MPMGVVNDNEFNSEVKNCVSNHKSKTVPSTHSSESNESSESNQTNDPNVEIVDMNKGRGHNPAVPNSLRQLIGELSNTEGRQAGLEMGERFGISPSSVSAYDNGSKSTASYNKQPNLEIINKARLRIQSRARKKLNLALEHITPEKLEGAKVKDLSGVARDMAGIIKDMEPERPKESTDNSKAAPQFIFYSPQFVKEESFDVVYSRE